MYFSSEIACLNFPESSSGGLHGRNEPNMAAPRNPVNRKETTTAAGQRSTRSETLRGGNEIVAI